MGVTGLRLLRSAIFAVDEELCAGSIRSRMTCSLTTGVITLRPTLMPRPSIAIALSFNSRALREVAEGVCRDEEGGRSSTGSLSTMVCIVETGEANGDRDADRRGSSFGVGGAGCESTTVFITAIGGGPDPV